MPFAIIRNDITKIRVDAIVNPTGTSLAQNSGVCGAIFNAAGADELSAACGRLAPVQPGDAVITPGFGLPAKHIIHAVRPTYKDDEHDGQARLRAYYTSSLELAVKHECESIAFPLISGEINGHSKADELLVATDVIRSFIGKHDIDVSLVVHGMEALAVGEELRAAVSSYVDAHYVDARSLKRRQMFVAETKTFAEAQSERVEMSMMQNVSRAASIAKSPPPSLDDMVGNLDEPFSATLLRLIDATGKKDAEIYRRANIDRRLFSKIRGNIHYAPSKATVLAFAVALELTLEQTSDLLGRAGFTLSHSRKFDVIVEYFIRNGKNDIFEINEVLFSYDQPLLGG